MLVLGISGSPRRGGNSEILLDEALDGAGKAGATVKKVHLASFRFSPCIGCGSCEKTGVCAIKDEITPLFDEIAGADALILSSSIYFYSVTAWTKAMIDRAQASWSRKYILKDPNFPSEGKKGAFIAVGATKGSKLFEGTRLTIQYFFDAVGYEYSAELLVKGVDEKGAIREHPRYLQAARELGVALVSKK
jgi:multimeric flavodoxin WrbA